MARSSGRKPSRDLPDWVKDVYRAANDHDPDLEPYASMSRAEIQALMREHTGDLYTYEMLNRHFLDKCSARELRQANFATELSVYLIEKWGAKGAAQCVKCCQVASEAAERLFGEMPPPGPLHQVN
jgi:hypothetical protein